MKTKIIAWWIGFKDGWCQPDDITSGMTWESPADQHLNEIYDKGVNVGQLVGALLKHARMPIAEPDWTEGADFPAGNITED